MGIGRGLFPAWVGSIGVYKWRKITQSHTERSRKMSSHNSSSVNDPRQPSAAKPFVATPVAPQDLPIDYAGFIAVVFGVAGVMFRVRPLTKSLFNYLLISLNFNSL